MTVLSRWLAPFVLAAGFGAVAMAPAPARADDLARVIVDIADVIVRNNTPYYRYGNFGYNDRLIVVRDRYGRPTYYRNVPRYADYRYRPGPPYGVARGYYNRDCKHNGKCRTTYYDPRYDRRYDGRYSRYDDRYHRHDRHDRYGRDYRYDGRRWRDRDDD
ncbi:hypothetical protein [Lysobacter firmicutimachus]|uniref:Uncharacterized protein n=1 Tax=Lysobacter firmicutimachus TaxID=1792846 RepID=A0ABU8D0Z2_9GAMM